MENSEKPKKKIWRTIGIIVATLVISFGGLFLAVVLLEKKEIKERDDDFLLDMYKIFPINEYGVVPDNYRDCVHSVFSVNGYLESNEYFFSKIPDRAAKVIAYGDFSNDGSTGDNRDMAFILEKNDFASSALFMISDNCLLLFHKSFESEMPTISSFKKGSKIFMDAPELVAAPADGILLYFNYGKEAIIYNPKTKKFEQYTQYSNQDLKDMKLRDAMEAEGGDEYEEGETDSITVEE